MYQVRIGYDSGSELFDISKRSDLESKKTGFPAVISNATAIIEAMRLSNLKDRRTGCYRKIIKVEVVQVTL